MEDPHIMEDPFTRHIMVFSLTLNSKLFLVTPINYAINQKKTPSYKDKKKTPSYKDMLYVKSTALPITEVQLCQLQLFCMSIAAFLHAQSAELISN
jgi:hypothetical protein